MFPDPRRVCIPYTWCWDPREDRLCRFDSIPHRFHLVENVFHSILQRVADTSHVRHFQKISNDAHILGIVGCQGRAIFHVEVPACKLINEEVLQVHSGMLNMRRTATEGYSIRVLPSFVKEVGCQRRKWHISTRRPIIRSEAEDLGILQQSAYVKFYLTQTKNDPA